MVIDHVSNLIVQIKNGNNTGKELIECPHSKIVESIAHTLKKSGYIKSVEVKGKKVGKTLVVGLEYIDSSPRIKGVERISKFSKRVYQRAKDIRVFRYGFGNSILSTPKGILIDTEAKKMNVGGEILFRIW